MKKTHFLLYQGGAGVSGVWSGRDPARSAEQPESSGGWQRESIQSVKETGLKSYLGKKERYTVNRLNEDDIGIDPWSGLDQRQW